MGIRWKLYSLAGGALAAEVAAYLLWRPRMLRWGATAKEASEPLPGDDRTPHPRVQSTRAVTIDAPPEQVWPWLMQMGIGRAGFYTHDWVERLMFRARYVEGKHSATRIHPEIPPLRAGDTVPMGAGAFATVSEAEPYRHLVAQETYVLRPLAGNKTRLIARYRGAGFVSPAAHAIRPDAGRLPRLLRFAVLHIPGVDLALRGFDLSVSDPLHHYMKTGMLTAIKARAEGKYSHASNTDPAAAVIIRSGYTPLAFGGRRLWAATAGASFRHHGALCIPGPPGRPNRCRARRPRGRLDRVRYRA
jgi:hypothetical protein